MAVMDCFRDSLCLRA